MHKLYDLKDQLVEELEKFAQGDIPKSEIPYIGTLAHAAKNVCKIIEACEDAEEENYSSRRMSRRMSRREDPMYESYDDGMSGRSMRRDNRGRFAVERGRAYSNGTEEDLERMMQDAPDERTRRALQQAIQTIRG